MKKKIGKLERIKFREQYKKGKKKNKSWKKNEKKEVAERKYIFRLI